MLKKICVCNFNINNYDTNTMEKVLSAIKLVCLVHI